MVRGLTDVRNDVGKPFFDEKVSVALQSVEKWKIL